ARLYALNTIGAISGALLGGFALLPAYGLQNTFRLAALVGLIAATGVLLMRMRTGRAGLRHFILVSGALAFGGVIVLQLPRWDLELLTSGAYKYAPYMRAGDFDAELRAGQLLYYKDGAVATVSVRQLAGMISLAIDGKVDASNMGD